MKKTDVRDLLIPQVQALYEAVLSHPTLSTVECQLGACTREGHVLNWESVLIGTLDQCLFKAFEEITHYEQVDVWLPIGENTYTFMSLIQKMYGIHQETFLLKRVIDLALATTQELIAYEQAMLKAGTFTEADVLNSMDMLSPLTFKQRIYHRGVYTPFEALSFDIQAEGAGSAEVCLNTLSLASVLYPAEPLLLKGLLKLRDLELGVQESEMFLEKIGL